ncbi:FkbM family methyltransferase [Zunongwangia sp. H14]|uniref:FkbM family methyltransferase n=1 Tax=Zunongwangia sp. H14 TaxID=3240792 RepID=UPI0035659B7A
MSKTITELLYQARILKFFNYTSTVKINNKGFKIPIMGEMGYTNLSTSEPWMTRLLEILLPQSSGNFLDVGANIGQTLLKLRSVNPKINYLGFEPNAGCLFYLRRLIEANNIQFAKIIPVGISEKTGIGKLNFFYADDADSCASMLEDFRSKKVYRKEYIPLFHYEELIPDLKEKTAFLKVDVEGGELEVLKSFKSKIASDKPFILLEILPVYKPENLDRKNRQDAIQDLLNSLQYSLYRIYKKDGMFNAINKVNDIGIHSNLEECDYVAVPSAKTEEFLERIEDYKIKIA